MKACLRLIVTAMISLCLLAGSAATVNAASGQGAPQSSADRSDRMASDTAKPDAVEAAACPHKVYFVYYKARKGQNVTKGRLLLKRYHRCKTTTLGSWRAGAGVNKNSCQKNRGWLPNGTYKIKRYFPNHQGIIKGRAWYLSDKRCKGKSKRLRTELFIHTEKPWRSPSSYYSNGCIKISPKAAKRAAKLQKRYGMPKRLYVKHR